MAVIFRCDSCKREFLSRTNIKSLTIPTVNSGGFVEADNGDNITLEKDLCATCMKQVIDLIEAQENKPKAYSR